MAAKQHILTERRTYNQWVNDQTLEDYALRFTAKSARKWSLFRVANTALGAISFLALEAIGAAITLQYGFDNAVSATIVVSLIIFLTGLPICYYAAKYGVDIDLLTRGAGFGYLGSTATSLIYASFTFIFFALEAAIMAKAMELLFGLPLAFGYLFSSLVVIPLVFYGFTFISRFQLWTQPLWILLQVLPFIFIAFNDTQLINEWQLFQGEKQNTNGTSILLFRAAASVTFALMAQIGEQVDFLRFLPPQTKANKIKWWCAMVLAGPGWIIIGAIKILAGSFLAVLAINYGVAYVDASDPTTIYSVAFNSIIDNQHLALIFAAIFVILCQLKINVTNAYAGSIAWSNFFSRLTHNHPGRVVWLVFNVAIALLLMELGIYHTFENTLSVYAIVAVSWVGSLVSDLVVNKPLGLSPRHIEFKRAHLYDINPVGIGSMIIASIIGIAAYLGAFNETSQALAHFIALFVAFITAPVIAVMTRSKYYTARAPSFQSEGDKLIQCIVCQNHYEPEDIAVCPTYSGNICSLCCSLNSRCHDSCKPDAPPLVSTENRLQQLFPNSIAQYVSARTIRFAILLAVICLITGILLTTVYFNTVTNDKNIDNLLSSTLWKVFFILMIIAGVISWLFVLARESQYIAQKESLVQTQKLIDEIEAHEETDKQLQHAKEYADAANNAKSRYLTGISHELRTPLNTVMGYAQLMEIDDNIPTRGREKASIIKRSSEHLADLIEGLLEISKIEAGKLDIQRNRIELAPLLQQLVDMFSFQAKDKGLVFNYSCDTSLPRFVVTDEKRLRQVLINLLSNAIKFTQRGEVNFSISYRNHVAQFHIADTGVGIPVAEKERIFEPFERVKHAGVPMPAGTGLGLTITRLLTDIMGGDISFESNAQGGTTFKLSLMLSPSFDTNKDIDTKHIYGYEGQRKTIFVVDDDPRHRALIKDLISPLGFIVIEASDGDSCLAAVKHVDPDMFLLDRLMPGMDGAILAKQLRIKGFSQPILMISATGNEELLSNDINPAYNGYILKPIKLYHLLENISNHLNISWIYEKPRNPSTEDKATNKTVSLEVNIRDEIVESAEIGDLSQLKNIAATLAKDSSIEDEFLNQFKLYIDNIDFSNIVKLVENSVETES